MSRKNKRNRNKEKRVRLNEPRSRYGDSGLYLGAKENHKGNDEAVRNSDGSGGIISIHQQKTDRSGLILPVNLTAASHRLHIGKIDRNPFQHIDRVELILEIFDIAASGSGLNHGGTCESCIGRPEPNSGSRFDDSLDDIQKRSRTNASIEIKQPPIPQRAPDCTLNFPVSYIHRKLIESELYSAGFDKGLIASLRKFVSSLSPAAWKWIYTICRQYKDAVTDTFTFEDSIENGWFPDYETIGLDFYSFNIYFHEIFPFGKTYIMPYKNQTVLIEDRYSIYPKQHSDEIQICAFNYHDGTVLFHGDLFGNGRTEEMRFEAAIDMLFGPFNIQEEVEKQGMLQLFDAFLVHYPEFFAVTRRRHALLRNYADYFVDHMEDFIEDEEIVAEFTSPL